MARDDGRDGSRGGGRGNDRARPDDRSDDVAASAGLDEAIADLYGGPLATFVPRRDELARALRSAGRRDDAAAVKARRKPRVPAWALDAARSADRAAFERVHDAAEAVGAAQGSGGDVRAAISELREAQQSFVGVAVRVAGDHDQRVGRAELSLAMLAVVGDPVAMAELEAGRLVDVPTGGGLGGAAFPAEAGVRGPASSRSAGGKPARGESARGGSGQGGSARGDPDRGEAEEESGQGAAHPGRRPPAAERRALQRAEREAAAADGRAQEAAERAAEATAALETAERELEAATERAVDRRRAADAAQRAAAEAAVARDEAAAALSDARDRVDGPKR